MIIYLHTNLYVMGYEGRTFIECPGNNGVTLRDALLQLTYLTRDKVDFLTGVREDFRFFLNGDEVLPTEEGFATELNDGDNLDVMIETLGG